MTAAKFAIRLPAIQITFALGFALLIVRAGEVQIVHGGEHATVARGQRTERVVLRARRGTLYDRNGAPLALSQQVFHVGVAPNELQDLDRDARNIAERLAVSLRTVRREFRQRYAYFHGPFSSTQVQPLRMIRGVHLTSELIRFYPDPNLARPLLGRPGSAGRPASGLERVLDTLLQGKDGSAVVLRDGRGRRYESPARHDAFPTPGHDVYLTIDADLQEIVEHALADAVEGFEALGGDVVVLNPQSGEVLAVASMSANGEGLASAFTNVFEPGSTAKLFAAAALLRSGLADSEDSVWAEQGRYQLGARSIEDDHPSGWLTLRSTIEQSSNIGMVKFASRLPPRAQYEMLRDFGLGTPAGIEYPAESGGLLKRPSEWSGTTPAGLAMGYEVAVTPLQLALAYAVIGNAGVLMQPTLIREVRDPGGKLRYRHVREPVRQVVTPEHAAELRAMLRGVVYQGGTGSAAALTTYEVAGKTGTALRVGSHGYIPGSYTASFTSLFPANDPQIAMVVKLDDPRGSYAAMTAAPITRAVLERLLAARSGALDPARLTVGPAPPEPPPAAELDTAPTFVVSWPPPPVDEAVPNRAMPKVTGMSVRAAARVLHRAGLRVRVEGWGKVVRTEPTAGTAVVLGSLVTIAASPGSVAW